MDPVESPTGRRERHPIPPFVERALREAGLVQAYRSRPPYQQNDYVDWVTRAKREETVQRRLTQMLEELAAGDRYMKMPYRSATGSASSCGRSASARTGTPAR